jgi:hypothetical protein
MPQRGIVPSGWGGRAQCGGYIVVESTDTEAGVSHQLFSISYSGITRPTITIDVEALAPALLAVGRLVRIANVEFNGEQASASVRVVSEFEHRCFNINFDTVISFLEHTKTMMGLTSDNLKSAKEILDQIGLTKPLAAAGGGGLSLGGLSLGGLSLYAYLRYRRGRKIESSNEINHARGGNVSVKIEGDSNPIMINNHIYNLSHNSAALKSVRDTFSPLGLDGIDKMEPYDPLEDRRESLIVGPNDAQDILASCNAGIAEAEGIEPDVVRTTAWVSVFSPVFDQDAKTWRFKLNDKTILADISATKIAENALARGGAAVDDAYEVRLEITTQRDANGRKGTPKYSILKVNKFVPGSPTMQASLFE